MARTTQFFIGAAQAAASPKVRARLQAAGFEPNIAMSADALARSIGTDFERNAALVKAFNIQP